MYPRNPSSPENGFSLMELLVAVTLIAVLCAIMLPVLGKLREGSQNVRCQANLRTISIGMHQYANDHQNWMPPHLETVTKPGGGRIYPMWYAWIAPYITGWNGKNHETTPMDPVFYCPANPYDQTLTYYGAPQVTQYSYGYVSRFLSSIKDRTYTSMPPIPRNMVREPARMILVTDIPPLKNGARSEEGLKELKSGWIHPSALTVASRHNGGSNLLFLDGHIEWRAAKDVMGTHYDGGNWNPYGHEP